MTVPEPDPVPARGIRKYMTMNRMSQALYFTKEIALSASKLIFTVAKGVGLYVAAVPGYVASWNNEYAVKRQRAVEEAATGTRFSPTSRRRSWSPQQGRASSSRVQVTSKKAKEAQERRVTRIVSQSLRTKSRSPKEKEVHASQENALFSISSLPALGSEYTTNHINQNITTPQGNEYGYSISNDFSGEVFRPDLTSTPIMVTSSPERGTPPLSQSTIEDLTASMPGALISYDPESPTPSYPHGLAKIKTLNPLGSRRISRSLHAAGAGKVSKYDNGITKSYHVVSDENRRPLRIVDKNALANKNNLMKQFRAPKGIQAIKNTRKETLSRKNRRSRQTQGKVEEERKRKSKEKDDPRLEKFERVLTRFARAGERRKFAEFENVPLVTAPLRASPVTLHQQRRQPQQQLQQPQQQPQVLQQQVQEQQSEQTEVIVLETTQAPVEPGNPPQEPEEQHEEDGPVEITPLPPAEPLASVPGSPQQVESQELSHLEDAPPPRTPKHVRWNTTAFTSPQVMPKVKYYIKDEKMSYPSNERLAPEFRNPHTPQPQIPDDFSLINDEQSLHGTPIWNVFEKYDTPEPVEGETSELEALRRGISGFHVSTRYKEERDRRRKETDEKRKKEEAERKAAEEKIKAEEEAERKKARQAERKAEEAAKAKVAAEAKAAAAVTAQKKLIRPLGDEMAVKVEKAMATSNKSSVLAQVRGVDLSRKDFGTVLPQSSPSARDGIGWLNDEIVNAYVSTAVDRQLEKLGFDRKKIGGQAPPLHAFNTNWYNTISTKGAQAVARWSKRAKLEGTKLLEVEHILFPINDGNHWTLLAVSGTKKQIWYLDSLGGKGKKYLETAKEWLKMELKEKYVEGEWKVVGGAGERKNGKDWTSPRQDNGVDCGVFTCFNALAVVRGMLPSETYSSADMWDARRQIAGTLLQGGFLGEFDWT